MLRSCSTSDSTYTPSEARLFSGTDLAGWEARRWFVVALLSALLAVTPWGPSGSARAAEPGADGDSSLPWIEALYREGDDFRAESEILRFTREHDRHPRMFDVELVRAKLYYREHRYSESALMLYSLLDRYPAHPGKVPGYRLLGLALVQQGSLDVAVQPLLASGLAKPQLEKLLDLGTPPPDAPDPEAAVAWSTWLPGSGFFVLDQPAKAVSALSLNLFFTAGTILAYRQENFGVALAFLFVEMALYSGGRQAVREEGKRLLERAARQRQRDWVQGAGEAELLSVGIPGIAYTIRFGGK